MKTLKKYLRYYLLICFSLSAQTVVADTYSEMPKQTKKASLSATDNSSTITSTAVSTQITSIVALGNALFHDNTLSKNRTISCASCHNDAHAFIDVRTGLPNTSLGRAVSVGDDGITLGNRNSPTLMYAYLSPVFAKNASNEYVGGFFHDGRANNLAGQAGAPPLNPKEMMMSDKASVVTRIKENASYILAFERFFGSQAFASDDNLYAKMAESIAAYESSAEFSTFDSKYDRSLLNTTDTNHYAMTTIEQAGLTVFNANCIACHRLKQANATQEPFTNYKYHNIGIPPNLAVQTATNDSSKDIGLLGSAGVPDTELTQVGKFKTPTLRNVAVTAPYMHNGVFKELRTVLTFYDHMRIANNPNHVLNPETNLPWGTNDFPETINHALLTMTVPLNNTNVNALIAFLNTLTDSRYESLIPTVQ
jgi:cytochrome c peroxidase